MIELRTRVTLFFSATTHQRELSQCRLSIFPLAKQRDHLLALPTVHDYCLPCRRVYSAPERVEQAVYQTDNEEKKINATENRIYFKSKKILNKIYLRVDRKCDIIDKLYLQSGNASFVPIHHFNWSISHGLF